MVEATSHIYDQAAYRASEAARILGLPAGTVNAWCFGHDYRHRDGTPKQFKRVIEPANLKHRELSFVNLCELHLLAVIRRRHGVKLLNASEQGQQALRDDFAQGLARIEFGSHGGPVLLFPFTRNASSGDDQPRSVVVDPERSFGRPVLAGIYVRTEVVEQRFRAGDTIAEMAEDHGVPAGTIEEALRFEHRSAA